MLLYCNLRYYIVNYASLEINELKFISYAQTTITVFVISAYLEFIKQMIMNHVFSHATLTPAHAQQSCLPQELEISSAIENK